MSKLSTFWLVFLVYAVGVICGASMFVSDLPVLLSPMVCGIIGGLALFVLMREIKKRVRGGE